MYTVKEVAKMLRISVGTVIRMIDDGEIKAIRVRGQWRIREEDYEAYLKKQENR